MGAWRGGGRVHSVWVRRAGLVFAWLARVDMGVGVGVGVVRGVGRWRRRGQPALCVCGQALGTLSGCLPAHSLPSTRDTTPLTSYVLRLQRERKIAPRVTAWARFAALLASLSACLFSAHIGGAFGDHQYLRCRSICLHPAFSPR